MTILEVHGMLACSMSKMGFFNYQRKNNYCQKIDRIHKL
jgi:hypothetical protein